MKIGVKLTVTFFGIAFLSMLVVSIISYYHAKRALEEEAFNRLTAVREMKAGQVSTYFTQIKDQLITFSEDPSMIRAMKKFKTSFDSLEIELKLSEADVQGFQKDLFNYFDTITLPRLDQGHGKKWNVADIHSKGKSALILQHQFLVRNPHAVDFKLKADSMALMCSYNNWHKKFHPVLRNICERFGFYDIFLIDNVNGNVVYTVYKETDFATSLMEGPFRETNLGKCFKKALKIKNKGEVTIVDFEPYIPSYNAPASFIACPIFDGKRMIGVIAFQMPIERIDDIMTNNKKWSDMGLGRTGETYLVGQDYTLRNQSRFLIEDSANYFRMLNRLGVDRKVSDQIREAGNTVGLQEVKTFGTEEALKGKSGTQIFNDYRGVSVLSSYKSLELLGMKWVIMSEIDEEEAFSHIADLRISIIKAFAVLLVLLILLSWVMSRQLTKPLKELTYDAQELAKGNFELDIKAGGKDEIGILAEAFKKMQASISSLVHGLEDKVRERTAEVTHQKHLIEEKQKEIVDSITYAKRIQYTLLAHEAFLKEYLKEHFVLFQPKDIVSGDFYWATKAHDRFYLAVCDSTGHGVPGAFMSLLNISFLNEAINEKKIIEPNEVLNYVREQLIKNISREGGQDGMDGILLSIDIKTGKMSFSGAHNAPLIIRGKELFEFKADKMPVGIGVKAESFTLHQLDVEKGDLIYLCTDGYPDQFGGPNGKKFMYKKLKEALVSVASKSMEEQKKKLFKAFLDWKGTAEQVDDITIIGLRV